MLFQLNDLQGKPEDFITASMVTASEDVISKPGKSISEVIGPLINGKTHHYVTQGRWSMHDLLNHILDSTGPADVYLTSYNITREPFEKLLGLKNTGRIEALSCVVDTRIKVNSAEVVALARYHDVKITTAEIHAKVLVVIGKNMAVAVCSSQNMTVNKRIESGVISVVPEVAQFHARWINQLINENAEQPNQH